MRTSTPRPVSCPNEHEESRRLQLEADRPHRVHLSCDWSGCRSGQVIVPATAPVGTVQVVTRSASAGDLANLLHSIANKHVKWVHARRS